MVAAVALAGCSSGRQCASPDAGGIVASFQPRQQFSGMLENFVKRSQTAAIISRREGPAAEKNLSQAIDSAVERHASEWEQNLVSGWATLSADELDQVCTALNERDQATFELFAKRVGPEVRSRNEPVLKRAFVEVLQQAF